MDEQRFDGLARRLATETSRRRLLGGLAAGVAGSLLASRRGAVSGAAAANAECAGFCTLLPPGEERGRCVSDAAHGSGLCFECGPMASDPARQLCGDVCVDTAADAANCGGCGSTCGSGETCDSGSCATPCPEGQTLCAGGCVALSINPANCGGCGQPCNFSNATAICAQGVCALGACASGWSNCDGEAANGCETDISTDPSNCGGCGAVCPAPANGVATCSAGACGFACLPGFENCDGNPATGCERDLTTDLDHCGACAAACPSAPNTQRICAGGVCESTCSDGFSPCGDGGTCCPNGFCHDGICAGGVCFQGALGCNPGPSHCVCLATYGGDDGLSGPTICTPADGAFCSAQRCSPGEICPAGSYCIPTSCDGSETISGRCAPVGSCPTGSLGCGDNCVFGETCQPDGICRAG